MAQGDTAADAAPEPEIVIGTREELLHRLAEAAEIEHTLMCSYLYAAFSLKRADESGVSQVQGDALAVAADPAAVIADALVRDPPKDRTHPAETRPPANFQRRRQPECHFLHRRRCRATPDSAPAARLAGQRIEY